MTGVPVVDNIAAKYEHRAQSAAAIRNILAVVDAQQLLGEAVSYTHLTLPTKA